MTRSQAIGQDGRLRVSPLKKGERLAPRLQRACKRFCFVALVLAIAGGAGDPSALPRAEGNRWIIPHQEIGAAGRSAPVSSSGGGWWVGSAGAAAVLAVLGGISYAVKRFTPRSETGPLKVVGRTSLSPKHTVYLLKAGDRTLIIGAGPGGSPTLLGEMPATAAASTVAPAPSGRAAAVIARFTAGGAA
jgi:hypothetical protein